MPEFTTHYLFGQSTFAGFSPEIKSIIENNISAFKWGLQGPDLLFYSKMIRDSGKMARAGASLHHCNPDSIFSCMLGYILTYKHHAEYSSLCSYFYGFVCHYALDSTTHPYVYSLVNKIDGQITTSRHAKVESEIASLMYQRLTGLPISSFNVYENYLPKGSFVTPISKMYVHIIKVLLNKTVIVNEVKSGFSFCLFLNRFTYLLANNELTNKKRTALLKGTKVLVRKWDFVNSFIKSNDVSNDTLNLMHDKWYNLNKPDKIYTYSFPELFDIAKIQALELSSKCSEMLRNGTVEPLGLIENFDSGEPEKSKKKPHIKPGNLGSKQIIKSRS